MNTHHARQNWFPCFSPDGIVTRIEAVNLIRKHGAQRLVLITDLTDAEIRDALPTAWLREHQQADMFRDAAVVVANDEHHPPGSPTPSPPCQSNVLRGSRPHAWDYLKKTLWGLFT